MTAPDAKRENVSFSKWCGGDPVAGLARARPHSACRSRTSGLKHTQEVPGRNTGVLS